MIGVAQPAPVSGHESDAVRTVLVHAAPSTSLQLIGRSYSNGETGEGTMQSEKHVTVQYIDQEVDRLANWSARPLYFLAWCHWNETRKLHLYLGFVFQLGFGYWTSDMYGVPLDLYSLARVTIVDGKHAVALLFQGLCCACVQAVRIIVNTLMCLMKGFIVKFLAGALATKTALTQNLVPDIAYGEA